MTLITPVPGLWAKLWCLIAHRRDHSAFLVFHRCARCGRSWRG